MNVIDADGHVEESPTMFGFLEKEYYQRRPLALGFDLDTVYKDCNAVWLIDGKAYPKLIGKGGVRFVTPTKMERAKRKPFSVPAQELTDVEARLKDLDKAGIDKQVVYPTLFLTTTTDDIQFEAALLRAYNSFLADVCQRSSDRIKFAALVPIRDVDESVRELRRAKKLGAVSVMLLGVAWDKSLGDNKLYPVYEEAARLNTPVCVHFGWGCPAITEAFEWTESFQSAMLPVVMGFHSIMASGILDRVPGLSFAFLESGCQWLPYAIHQLKRAGRVSRDPAEYFREGRIFVACEADEDVNYVASIIGEEAFVMASDYPHGDASHEENMRDALTQRADISAGLREKILTDNPRRLYRL